MELLPTQVEQTLQQAVALHQQGRLAVAKGLYETILKTDPQHFDALQLLGMIAAQTRNFQGAVELLNKALLINPNHAASYNNLGNALRELKRLDEALVSYDMAIRLKADYAEAYNNRGNTLKDLKQLDAALSSYDKAISLKPDYANAYLNRGNALKGLKRLDEALAGYDKAISLKADYAEAYNNRGNALNDLRRFDEALASYDKAISLKAGYAEAYNNRGNALKELKQLDRALASYDKAISLKPDYAEAWCYRGNALKELGQPDAALASYDKAIGLNPDYADACNNRGNTLKDLKRLDEALASYQKAIDLEPDYEFLPGMLFHTRKSICDWRRFDFQSTELIQKIEREEKVSNPFLVLALVDSPSIQKTAARVYAQTRFPLNNDLGAIPKRTRPGKIRIGYYSADFHNHATAYLMAEFFETHDSSAFELVAFSFGPDQQDDMRKRLTLAFDRFIDVRNQSDRQVAQLSREIGIDIAVDLKAYTKDSRTGIFAYRAAPVQVNYLGYPGTMASEYIDYIVADKTLIADGEQQYYSESVVFLPNSYMCNDRKRVISDKQFTRQELGLPEEGFVFCCFNNNYKITPNTFDCWMRILKAAEGSVLWLFENNPWAAENLKKEAEDRGIQADRLVFAKRMPLPEHLARHRQADLFIDTLPYNAHTTASDALWAGLPVLTLAGRSFASRVAASLLNAIELPELITTSQQEYEALAIELATDPQKLARIKLKLDANRLTTPLFDTPLFTCQFESALKQMHDRYRADLPPAPIHIEP